MSDRIKSIIQSDDGRAMPELAEHLCFETELAADAALKVLAAARKDVAAAGAQIAAGNVDNRGGQSAGITSTFTGSLGVADRVGGDSSAEAIKAGWAKALARHNANV